MTPDEFVAWVRKVSALSPVQRAELRAGSASEADGELVVEMIDLVDTRGAEWVIREFTIARGREVRSLSKLN